MHRDITEDQARAILQILKDECGYTADPYNGEGFIRSIQAPNPHERHICQEYRFCGRLGFGGKFRNNGNQNNTPYVDCYPEHVTKERLAMIDRANKRLSELFALGQDAEDRK
jgi:hypothetical protein